MHYSSYKYIKMHIIQSYIRTILFILFFILFPSSNISAENKSDTIITLNKQHATPSESLRFGVRLAATLHEPFYYTGYYWDRYFTTGLHMDFPTYIPRMLVRFSAEAGLIDKKDESIKGVIIIHTSVSVSYDFPIVKEKFSVRPRLGLSSVFITTMKSDDIVENIFKDFEIFSIFENEFGIIGGFESIYRIKRFQITLPITGNIVFSSPNPIITANVSLTAGVVF